MKVDKIIQIGASTLVVVTIVSTATEALNKEPANIPNVTYEQTPHTPDNQQPVPQYTLVDSTISTGSTATTVASGNLAAKLLAAGIL